jgi:MFS family permease
MSRSEKQTLGIDHADFPHLMTMTALIVAGEAIFSLPFHVTRFFRPTFLEVFEFSNLQLGLVQASYGVIAMLAYFPGGQLADIFPARKLLAASLMVTGLGGLYFAQIPTYQGLHLLFGFWGFTTILLFWGALIRATREWGSVSAQGRAFGILDGGRGLFAALISAIAVFVLRSFFPRRCGTRHQRGAYFSASVCDLLLYPFHIYGSTFSLAVCARTFSGPCERKLDCQQAGFGKTYD